MEKFKKLVNDLTAEYIEKNGRVTCEFSMGYPSDEHIEYLIKVTNNLKTINSNWEWASHFCSTCESHDKTRPYHIEIRDLKYND